MRYIILLFSTIFLFIACSNPKSSKDENNNEVVKEKVSEHNIINQTITTVPNPLEMSYLLHKSGVVFNKNLLSNPENAAKFKNKHKIAINAGIYATDYIHMSIYEKSSQKKEYLDAIKALMDELEVGKHLDYEGLLALQELDNSITDSSIFILNTNYERINNELIKANQSGLSVLIAYGSWIESMYLATHIKKVINPEAVNMRIADQKNVLDNLFLMLSLFNNQKEFKKIIKNLRPLIEQYDDVSISYEYRAPTIKTVNGDLVIIDNSKSTIQVSENFADTIGSIITDIRNQLVTPE